MYTHTCIYRYTGHCTHVHGWSQVRMVVGRLSGYTETLPHVHVPQAFVQIAQCNHRPTTLGYSINTGVSIDSLSPIPLVPEWHMLLYTRVTHYMLLR